MYILTSNQHKINEYLAFGIDARRGPDTPEVKGTVDEVIIYKVLRTEPNVLVEDTVLIIAGQEIVDSKYTIKEIGETDDASWVTSIGYHDGTDLYIFRGVMRGRIVSPIIEQQSSFEPCFIPEGAETTLYELRLEGKKDMFSARRLAIEAFRHNKPIIFKRLSTISQWEGEYQNGYNLKQK